MSKAKFLSRTTDYLGDLGSKLRDLQGYATLSNELIQNADDAPASWMRFNIGRESLILENDGIFTSCNDVEASQCSWRNSSDYGHRCDFHRFRLIGSGDKRLQEGTTGAFGIGFISVYQLTDQPELISAGRHWKLHEERTEDKRIEVCLGCIDYHLHDLPGTRFILPFARDEETILRQALKAEPVPVNIAERLQAELERSLPVAMLFLKNLRTIEVHRDGRPSLHFEREIDNGTLLITSGASRNDRIWHLLYGSFDEAAEKLRRQHSNRIEEKRSTEVVVALDAEDFSDGLLCACLPTEERPGLPFHVNADFFPSNDRKRIILADDYQSLWNRAALLAAARIVAEATPSLIKMLGAERFWHLVQRLQTLAGKDSHDKTWTAYWENLQIPLKREAVILTSAGEWTTSRGGVALLQHEGEAANIPVLEGLGIKLVAEDLRSYQTTMRSVGVPYFDIKRLCIALSSLDLKGPVDFTDLPPSLSFREARESLWTQISILLGRQPRNLHEKRANEERLSKVSIAPTVNKALWPCQETFRAEKATIELFLSLGLDIPFLDQKERAFEPLAHLCAKFRVENAVEVLESANPSSLQQRLSEDNDLLRRLIEWFAIRREEITTDNGIRARLASLPIYPSMSRQLHALTSLVLPGDFEDPFGLTNLVAVDAIGGHREFLLALGVHELDFRTYILEYLPHALKDENLNPAIRDSVVSLLAGRIGELRDDHDTRVLLAGLPLVMCTDGKSRRADDCYFPSELIQEILGGNANIVVLPREREASVRELFTWLGVKRAPRIGDIVLTVRRIVEGPCTPSAVLRIQKIVAHLGSRFEGLTRPAQLKTLQRIDWLPARRDRKQWHKPQSLYAPYQSYLFDSQAPVLDVPQSTSRNLLDFLGVHISPSASLVVRHLLCCAKHNHPVNAEVYRFLNDNADDSAIEALRSQSCLWLGDAYRSPEHVFWSDHPFGQYRWRLAENLRGYGNLLEKIGVVDRPDHSDAIEVLLELSSDFSTAARPLADQEYAVLVSCWAMVDEALDVEKVTEEELESLKTIKSIPNKANILYFPTWLFFENRAGLAGKFESYLEGNVIARPLKTGRAFQAAGVRQLVSAVQLELLRSDDPELDRETSTLLRQRRQEIARVLSSQMHSHDVQDALEKLNDLECMSATSLVVRYCLTAFDRVKKSKPESVPALYEPNSNSLWTTRANGNLPWTSLARELAGALRPEEDPGLFAAGLKEVLAADTSAHAATVLDELGFSGLDTSIVERPLSSEAANNLGVESPVEACVPDYHNLNDKSPSISSQEDEHDHVTTEDALHALGITQAPTDPISDMLESTTSTGSRRGGTLGTRSGGRRKFVSYVSLLHEDEEELDLDGLTSKERLDLEENAIALIIKEETELKRTPTNNPGFDLIKLKLDGQPARWVEVKAMKGTMRQRPVGISRTQFEWAQKKGKAFWLYIVENAGTPDQARILKIQDPAGKSQTFTFDHGWLSIAEAS